MISQSFKFQVNFNQEFDIHFMRTNSAESKFGKN